LSRTTWIFSPRWQRRYRSCVVHEVDGSSRFAETLRRTRCADGASCERPLRLLAMPGQRAQSALQAADARRTNSATGVEHSLEGMEGIDYAPYETSFEANASEGSRTGGGSRRRVFVASERRIRCNRYADGGYAVAGHGGAPNHSQGGRDLRRQLGDVLRLRQGNRRNTPTRSTICPSLRQRLRRLQGLQRLRQRLQRLRRLRRLRLRRLRLLLAVGRLPRLLDSRLERFPITLTDAMAGFDQCGGFEVPYHTCGAIQNRTRILTLPGSL
jgi:hypothetical protein